MITVTVPSGVKPGQSVQVAGAKSGMTTVIVPDGVAEGDTFQVGIDGGRRADHR